MRYYSAKKTFINIFYIYRWSIWCVNIFDEIDLTINVLIAASLAISAFEMYNRLLSKLSTCKLAKNAYKLWQYNLKSFGANARIQENADYTAHNKDIIDFF